MAVDDHPFLHDLGDSDHPGDLQDALRIAQDRFEKIFLASPVAISVSTLDEGRFLDVNPVFADVLGYEREEIVGRTSKELGIWRDFLERSRVTETLRNEGVAHNVDVEYRARDGRTGYALSSLVRTEFGGEDCLLALTTDVTERRTSTRRLKLLQRVSRSITEAPDLTSALIHALREICVETGWRFGECWLPSREEEGLVLGGAWGLENGDMARFHRLQRGRSPLPSRESAEEIIAEEVWRSSSSLWVPDLGSSSYSSASDAVDVGLEAAIGIPVFTNRRIVAALVFYLSDERERDPELVELVTTVAGQLGMAIERRRSEEALQDLVDSLDRGEYEPGDWAGDAGPERLFLHIPAPAIVVSLDEEKIVTANRAFERLSGYGRDELLGRIDEGDDLWVDRSSLAETIELVRMGASPRDASMGLRRRSGSPLEVEVSAEGVAVGGEACAVMTLIDVTERGRRERQLRRQALHDPVTGLPNRTLFLDRIRHAAARARREARRIAVFIVDLDRFNVVNDSLGQRAGDELLAATARRLASCLRDEDSIARLAGDRFALLVEEVEDFDDARAVADRVRRALEPRHSIRGTAVHIQASMGAALSSPRDSDPEDLLRFADIALRRAKTEGKEGGSFRAYDSDIDRAAAEKLQIENDLRSALENQRFVLWYQPIISLMSGRIEAAEALIRWDDPDRGLMPPHRFIPEAEESGLILPIGEWVVRRAVRQVAAWREEGIVKPDFRLAFNLSPKQFRRPGLLDLFARLLSETDVPPACLQIEVTETVALSDPDTLDGLRRLGLGVAIDDVGTGYASLENLARLDVDAFKIDRTFVAGLVDAPRDEAVVEALILIARRLNVPVVGEGIETIDQLHRLRDLGCALGQGFFFSKPLDRPVFEELIARDPHW